MTVQNLIDEILRKVGETDPDTATSNVALDAVKSALRRIPRFARNRRVVKTDTLSLSAAEQSLTIIGGSGFSDFIQERFVWYVEDGRRQEIVKAPDLKTFNSYYSTSDSGAPEMYRVYGTTIEFNRPADQAYTVYVEYYSLTSEVSTTDTLIFQNDILEIIKDGALEYFYDYQTDTNMSNKHGRNFISGLKKLEDDFYRNETPDYIESTD